ncbi:MAG: hypothetical protein M1818_007390 [Claussenomyces sp. TS43310]|nr:MAG: hypothetical protein M1818_007390 [Claussenomyces sp. TS43310]
MLLPFFSLVFGTAAVGVGADYVNQTTCNGKTYTYQELAGYGAFSGNATDKFGDTVGGMGSSIAIDRQQWKKLDNGSYSGVLWALPDRGWNTEGTLNFQPRVHKFKIILTPQPDATVVNPSGNNLDLIYEDTIRFSGPDGTPCTGLDADGSGHLSYPGFPDLPVATYTGDGFGNSGSGGKRVPVDSEGIFLNPDGTFWVSDEYGPYIYRFNQSGTMIQAIRPNDAIIPMRHKVESFSADSPPFYDNNGDDVSPADNPTGRDNNHGFEGLTITADGQYLYALLQAAANQEGGLGKQTERYARLVRFNISDASDALYDGEYVVPLPLYDDPTAKASKNPKVAAQSEIFHVAGTQFLVLARDSGAGHGADSSTSVYRHADVFDIAAATDVQGATYDCTTCAIASSDGVLDADITPAAYCSFLDFNVEDQLNRFGVHNGGDQDASLLNEKWESLAMVPVDGDQGADGQWFLFSLSDNDFITQHGSLDGGAFTYADSSGYNLDNQALVFQVTLPQGSSPYSPS